MGCRGDYRIYLRTKIRRLEEKLKESHDYKDIVTTRKEINELKRWTKKNINHNDFGEQTLANYSVDDTIDMSL